MLLLCALAGLGFSAQTAVVDAINNRFASGQPSNNLTMAGVLIHQFDSTEGGDDAMDERWLPCPKTCYGHACWCASVGDRWSTSMVNTYTPRTSLNELILFSKRAGGLIVSPNNTVLCSYPQDGATADRVCDQPGACIPGCYTEVLNHSTPKPCWCDEIAPAWSCPISPSTNRTSPCAWKPTDLAQMMQRQAQVNTYNEVIVATSEYAAGLPHSLDAIFFLASAECHAAPNCEPLARSTHAAVLAKYNLTADRLPLLSLNVTEPMRPFQCVAC